MPDELYYLSRGKLTQKQGLYSKISKMQLEADLRSKNRAPYWAILPYACIYLLWIVWMYSEFAETHIKKKCIFFFLFSVLGSDCIELDFKEISYLVVSLFYLVLISHFSSAVCVSSFSITSYLTSHGRHFAKYDFHVITPFQSRGLFKPRVSETT